MSSVTRIRNIYRPSRNHRRAMLILLAAALVSQASFGAAARSGLADGIMSKLVRFNFTGTFRFKPRPQLKRPAPSLITTRPTIVAKAANATPSKQQVASARIAVSVKKADTSTATPNDRQDAQRSSSRHIKIGSETARQLRSRATQTSQTVIAETSQSPVEHRPRQTTALKPTTKLPARAAPEEHSAPSSSITHTAAISPKHQGSAAEPSQDDSALLWATRSSLGAENLGTDSLAKDAPRTVETAASSNAAPTQSITARLPAKAIVQPRQSEPQPSVAKSTAAPAVTTKTKPIIINVASATPDKPVVNSRKTPIAGDTSNAVLPPLPTKYRRPVIATKRKRSVVKRKVTKVVATKKKSKPKSPASSWASAAPRWASGAFRTD